MTAGVRRAWVLPGPSGASMIRATGLGLALTSAVLGGPLADLHAQPAKSARLAILGPGGPINVAPFREGLRDLGWVEGQNLVVEARYAEWHYERLPELARELVRWRPDVIFTNTTPGVLAAEHATSTIPIVVGAAGQVVEKRIVKSLSQPGGNITGLTLVDAELDAKRLQLLREILPRLRQVAVLRNPTTSKFRADEEPREEAARMLGLQLLPFYARDSAELEGPFSAMTRGGVEALLVTNDAALGAIKTRIIELAVQHRLPVVSELPEWAEAGALLAYGPRIDAMFRRAAVYADKILKGARPGDLPIERPDTFTLVVNLKTAKALGIALPPSILARADQAIQ
jgi:putative ABC transport system substrate-binding protein